VYFNNEEDDLFPMEMGLSEDSEFRIDSNSGTYSSTNMIDVFLRGDISSFMSYSIGFGAGLNNIDSDAYSPYSYSKTTDGYSISLSGGLDGGGLEDGDQDGLSFGFTFSPEISMEFFDNSLQIGFSRERRDVGNGEGGNLTLSSTARPYDGIDFNFRPSRWFNFYYSFGALGNWFDGSLRSADEDNDDVYDDDELIYSNMFTTQVFEFMPTDWFYLLFSNSVVWGKRFEIAYMTPFMFPLFAQNLIGDQDNAAIELSMAFKLPIGIEIYGSLFADELRFTDIFTDPAVQLAVQAGVRWVIPKLPFTIATFQYTYIDPYTYTHYAQAYSWSDSDYLYDISWTNDEENLGYYLPPNSDEFLLRIESYPSSNVTMYFQYQYIRHGEGDWDEGEMEGDTSSGGTVSSAHAYDGWGLKDFLNDGIYETLNIPTIGLSYEFTDYPLQVEADYSFIYATNYDNIEGNNVVKNLFGFLVHIYPDN
jgi:hypothetical protein